MARMRRGNMEEFQRGYIAAVAGCIRLNGSPSFPTASHLLRNLAPIQWRACEERDKTALRSVGIVLEDFGA